MFPIYLDYVLQELYKLTSRGNKSHLMDSISINFFDVIGPATKPRLKSFTSPSDQNLSLKSWFTNIINVTKVKLFLYGEGALKPCRKSNSVITLSLLTIYFEKLVKIILNFKCPWLDIYFHMKLALHVSVYNLNLNFQKIKYMYVSNRF